MKHELMYVVWVRRRKSKYRFIEIKPETRKQKTFLDSSASIANDVIAHENGAWSVKHVN
jgi:hypothetical protein